MSGQVTITGSSDDDTLFAPVFGDALLDGGNGNDRAVLNGNVGDYTLSRFSSPDLSSSDPRQGAFVLASLNGSGTLMISEATETVQFQNGQYLSLPDLAAYVQGSDTFTTGSDNADILVTAYAGNQTITGGGGTDNLYLHGNVGDYTLRATPDPSGNTEYLSAELLPLNSSGTLTIDNTVEDVHFQNGQVLAFGADLTYIPQTLDLPGTNDDDILIAPKGGDAYIDGQGGNDRAILNGNVHDYTLSRVQAGSGRYYYNEDNGSFVLSSKNGSGNIEVNQSTETIQFQNGQYLSLQDLAAYITGDPSLKTGTLQDDILLPSADHGDQQFIGRQGNDNAFLHGNVKDYTIAAGTYTGQTSDPTTPVVTYTGFELTAKNGSGNQFIDQSTETVHFQNGQYLSYNDLTSYIAPTTLV